MFDSLPSLLLTPLVGGVGEEEKRTLFFYSFTLNKAKHNPRI
jgi:hypothetical protein